MARVLVIDDALQIRGIIRQMLAGDGHEVTEAADGAEGIARIRDAAPQIVITDVVMPNHEGLETLRELRQQMPDVPILVMSGNENSVLYLRLAELLGAHATLRKPFNVTQLLRAVDRLLAAPPSGASPG